MGEVGTTALDWLSRLLRTKSGLIVGPDKLYLLETRLRPLLEREGLPCLDALVDRLQSTEASALTQETVEAMTTNETLFFRDAKPFDHLVTQGLAEAAASRPPGQPVRIWSAGAATGQEAYSIAMLAAEHPALLGGRAVQILGTDIATGPLGRAQHGVYTQFEVQRGLPMRRLVSHFEKVGDGWRVRERLRAMCQFTIWNLLDDPAPLGCFDIVFCRNVLIYFDEPTKRRVLDALARRLSLDGWLYLGVSETAVGLCSALRQCGTGLAIYRRADRLH